MSNIVLDSRDLTPPVYNTSFTLPTIVQGAYKMRYVSFDPYVKDPWIWTGRDEILIGDTLIEVITIGTQYHEDVTTTATVIGNAFSGLPNYTGAAYDEVRGVYNVSFSSPVDVFWTDPSSTSSRIFTKTEDELGITTLVLPASNITSTPRMLGIEFGYVDDDSVDLTGDAATYYVTRESIIDTSATFKPSTAPRTIQIFNEADDSDVYPIESHFIIILSQT